jgi:hypothetical protein
MNVFKNIYQSEVIYTHAGSAYGIRTRVADVRGQRPRPLDERALKRNKIKD